MSTRDQSAIYPNKISRCFSAIELYSYLFDTI
uniref:Uncharacterized protein n=1 Tax=Arundo donax TaxID=35708 RepID=A0A0A8YBZ4_ARUDO